MCANISSYAGAEGAGRGLVGQGHLEPEPRRHDPHKVYAAFHAAVNHKGQPTLILPKTIKGYGMGESGEAQNITHQQKKMSIDSIRVFRDRFQIPVPDDKLEEVPFVNSRQARPRPNT